MKNNSNITLSIKDIKYIIEDHMSDIVSMAKFNIISKYQFTNRLREIYDEVDNISTFLMCSNKITTSQYSEIMEVTLELKEKYIKKFSDSI